MVINPSREVVVFLRATDSLTVFFQQLGRALRKTALKTKVIILDFVSNVERLIMVRDLMNRVREIQEANQQVKLPLDTNPFHVAGEGFEFIFSDEMVDIMKVIEALREGYYKTWQEASIASQNIKIESYRDYRDRYKEDLRLPSTTALQKMPGFPGWTKFLAHRLPPEGWRPIDSLYKEKNLGLNTGVGLKNFLKLYRKSFKEFFGQYWTIRGYKEHIHPTIISRVHDEFTIKRAPPGWKSDSGLITVINKHGQPYRILIKSIVATLSEETKKDQIQYFSIHGRLVKHYSPTLCDVILPILLASIKIKKKKTI